ncbi:MAG: DUF6600 domain-containing protein [Terriglobia bacterium]
MRTKFRPQFRLTGLVLSVPLAVLVFPLVAPRPAHAQDDSQARVVRLSFVEGTVGLLQSDSSEWAEAAINTPIQEGYEVATQKDSFAEVQFENASTLRLGELSSVHFDQLGISDSGRRATQINFENGYGTVHIFSDSSAEFEVKVGDSIITPQGECEFRIDRNDQALRVEMWSGAANFSGPLGNIELDQNQVLTYAPGSGEPYDVESGLTQDDWDRWVAARDQAEASSPGSVNPVNYGGMASNNLYGWSDLANYGTWTYYTDVGYAWCPYVSYNWAPYSFGRWVWYPGFGYTWVSFEPWGWLPYHFGQWAYEPGTGWAWVPHSFANWSPALVNWYQGPGWIGWTPQIATTTFPGAFVPCARSAHGCFRALSVKQFQDGVAVTPQAILQVDPQQGRKVRKPDLPATRLAMLPGVPMAHGSVAVGSPRRQGGAAPPRTLPARSLKPGPNAAAKPPAANPSRPPFRSGAAPAGATHPGRAPSASPAIEGRPSPVPHSHFSGAAAPRSSLRPAAAPVEGLDAVNPVPYRVVPSSRSAPAPAGVGSVAPHATVSH